MHGMSIGETVRRERRWTPAGATPAPKLVRSTKEADATKLAELRCIRIAVLSSDKGADVN